MTLTRENPDIAPTANQFFDKEAPEDSIVSLMFDTCNESRNFDAKHYDFCFQRKSTTKSQPAGRFQESMIACILPFLSSEILHSILTLRYRV